jgi:hypothetical protein
VVYDPAVGLHAMSDDQLSALFHDIDSKSLQRDDLCLVNAVYIFDICVYKCICVYMHICVSVHIYICIHVYMYELYVDVWALCT